jgi:hypothetical protein
MNLTIHLCVFLLLLGGASAQDSNSTAKATAKAVAKASGNSSRSHTRKIVVRNGKTIVDEETVDGKSVRPSRRARPGSTGGVGDLDRLLKDLEKDMPPEARGLLRRAGGKGVVTSSATRRIVVRDGKTIVDEQTLDGKRVRPGQGAGNLGAGELDRLLKDLEKDMPPEARDLLRRAGADSKKSVVEKSKKADRRGASRGTTQPKRGVGSKGWRIPRRSRSVGAGGR